MGILKRSNDFRKEIYGKTEIGSFLEFIRDKRKLISELYPIKATKESVLKHFTKSQEDLVKHIDDKTILLVVPSSQGAEKSNPIPGMFADLLRTKTNCRVMNNEKLDLCYKTSNVQIKNNTTITKRNKNEVDFFINENNIQHIRSMITKMGFKAVVLDDAITTGETANRFTRRLENAGIPVSGMVGLVVGSKYQPTKQNIDKLSEKLRINLPQDKAHLINKEFNKKLYAIASPLTIKYLNRLDREFNKQKDALNIVRQIEKKYANEKENFPQHIEKIENYYQMNFEKNVPGKNIDKNKVKNLEL